MNLLHFILLLINSLDFHLWLPFVDYFTSVDYCFNYVPLLFKETAFLNSIKLSQLIQTFILGIFTIHVWNYLSACVWNSSLTTYGWLQVPFNMGHQQTFRPTDNFPSPAISVTPGGLGLDPWLWCRENISGHFCRAWKTYEMNTFGWFGFIIKS